MKVNNNIEAFRKTLNRLCVLYREKATPELYEAWEDFFSDRPLEESINAMKRHTETNKFFPAPADIISLMHDPLQFPGAEEAFSMLPRSESEGAWMNQISIRAWSICSYSLERGDEFQARLQFKEKYEQLVELAKNMNNGPEWFWSAPSIGNEDTRAIEKTMRTEQMVTLGYFTPERAQLALAKLPRKVDVSPSMRKLIGVVAQDSTQ